MQHLQQNNIEVIHLLKQQVFTTCKILVNLHLDSGPFGNISVRLPGSNIFCVNPEGLTFDQLKPQDILCIDIEENGLGNTRKPHPGTFIHREIYRLRSDINAIVHTHSKNTVLMSLLGCTIEPFTQLGAAIYNDQGIYHGFTGPVRTSDEGREIATALADKSIVIAKNHGVFTTGQSIQSALWDMVVTDLASDIHIAAQQLGLKQTEKLSTEYMEKSKIEVRDKQCDYMWKNYLEKISGYLPKK